MDAVGAQAGERCGVAFDGALVSGVDVQVERIARLDELEQGLAVRFIEEGGEGGVVLLNAQSLLRDPRVVEGSGAHPQGAGDYRRACRDGVRPGLELAAQLLAD